MFKKKSRWLQQKKLRFSFRFQLFKKNICFLACVTMNAYRTGKFILAFQKEKRIFVNVIFRFSIVHHLWRFFRSNHCFFYSFSAYRWIFREPDIFFTYSWKTKTIHPFYFQIPLHIFQIGLSNDGLFSIFRLTAQICL